MAADVPGDGPVQLGAVRLPAGRQLSRWGEAGPRLWATSEPVPEAGRVWHELADMREDTGLVPILLAFLHRGQEGRPRPGASAASPNTSWTSPSGLCGSASVPLIRN